MPADSRHGRSRRSWSAEEKRQIIAETREPGASVATVARRHDINANLLFTWRRAAEAMSRTGEGGAVAFVPATITADPVPATAPPLRSDARRMEISLAGGDRVIVGADVDPVALARVIKVLWRR